MLIEKYACKLKEGSTSERLSWLCQSYYNVSFIESHNKWIGLSFIHLYFLDRVKE